MHRRLFWIVVGVVFFCSLSSNTVYAQSNIYKIHSLFIYNFTKHVQWNSVGDNFTIGVFGSANALKEVKASFAGKKFAGKEIRVINVTGIGDANASQLVYTPRSNKSEILNIFEGANKNNTLFVSEDDLVEHGFPISFVLKGTKLGFKVSKKNLESSGLKISSSLLSLAEVVD